ncbi:ABC transporter permease [Pseudomonas arcuscaelestis]|uniref:ABC transporter permease n=1 Tax=Pseudomonas arcuscaelestis TaxID=2710591 RepID=UPI00193E1917|nr:ABC transporter permease [Pseudomonas arcuscaelestis]MBM3110283.1 ABC transporter permease [Pseudomonas arcuscaelestis]
MARASLSSLSLPAPATRGRGLGSAYWTRLQAWYLPLGLAALWWLASRNLWMSEQILPAPSLVWQSAQELAHGELWAHLAISLQRLLIGLLAGVSCGALLGAWLGFSRRAERLVLPTFNALAQIPTLAWVPLFMVLFGIGELLKLVVLVKAIIVPVTLHTLVGVRDAQPRLREAAAVLKLPRRLMITRLILPAALPAFLAGVRLALATGWSSLLAVELLTSSEGIGYLMVWARQLFMLDIVFVCIAVIGLIGFGMDRGLGWLDRRLVYWPHPPGAELRVQPLQGSERLQALLLPLTLLLIWQLANQWQWVDSNILVAPLQVLGTAWKGVVDGTLTAALAVSVGRALAGLVLGGGLGFALGLWLGLSHRAERLLGPSLAGLRQIAIFAWVPLLTAWFGLGEPAKWVFVGLAAFFPLFIATQRSVANRSPQLDEAARVLHLNLPQQLMRLVLPGAAPGIFAGLRVGLIYAWLGTIGAEYFMPSGGGIGSLMIGAQQLLRMDLIMAGMLLVGLTGALLGALGQHIESRATRWRRA